MKQYGGRPTQLAELNELLGQIVSQVKSSLGHNFVGAYLQGSFALGDAEMLTWTKLDSPWAQRYAVTTLCRILYTLETGQVASKRVSLLWVRDNLDPKWQELISEALEGRSLGWNHWDPVKPGALEATLVFNEYANNERQETHRIPASVSTRSMSTMVKPAERRGRLRRHSAFQHMASCHSPRVAGIPEDFSGRCVLR